MEELSWIGAKNEELTKTMLALLGIKLLKDQRKLQRNKIDEKETK